MSRFITEYVQFPHMWRHTELDGPLHGHAERQAGRTGGVRVDAPFVIILGDEGNARSMVDLAGTKT